MKKGSTLSPEHREAISKALRGKPKSAAHKKATSRALVLYWAGVGKTPETRRQEQAEVRRQREIEKLERRLAALRGES